MRFNFEGWSLGKWVKGNKDLLKIAIPGLIAYLVTQNWIDAGIAGIISKPILDVIDYYIGQ